mmetsp:Transcript_30002/g.73873  ORF Transcript_30002/g.73873 Transcript_30002/m.73873 type:complete len:211 (+) Transcript_30002:1352-1984(+)
MKTSRDSRSSRASFSSASMRRTPTSQHTVRMKRSTPPLHALPVRRIQTLHLPPNHCLPGRSVQGQGATTAELLCRPKKRLQYWVSPKPWTQTKRDILARLCQSVRPLQKADRPPSPCLPSANLGPQQLAVCLAARVQERRQTMLARRVHRRSLPHTSMLLMSMGNTAEPVVARPGSETRREGLWTPRKEAVCSSIILSTPLRESRCMRRR